MHASKQATNNLVTHRIRGFFLVLLAHTENDAYPAIMQ